MDYVTDQDLPAKCFQDFMNMDNNCTVLLSNWIVIYVNQHFYTREGVKTEQDT
jgi:hypothetical protein